MTTPNPNAEQQHIHAKDAAVVTRTKYSHPPLLPRRNSNGNAKRHHNASTANKSMKQEMPHAYDKKNKKK